VQVASIREKKGHIDTVRAFLHARSQCPGLHLTLVGTDPEGRRAELQRLIDAAGAAADVSFQERVEFADLHALLAEHDVFIHPSCVAADGDCEGGAPVVLLDAQAVGLPVIATRHCDIPREVIDGVTGLLSAEHDWSSLARTIVRFYSMADEEFQTFSAAARAHVVAEFDSRRVSARLREVYGEILAAATPAGAVVCGAGSPR
jgi:colanic acid/amylovoran biosynthesis glycosyltransferase